MLYWRGVSQWLAGAMHEGEIGYIGVDVVHGTIDREKWATRQIVEIRRRIYYKEALGVPSYK